MKRSILSFKLGATVENIDSMILIREFNEDTDVEVVQKLEKSCKTGPKRGLSMLNSVVVDPLCRVRLYPIRVLLVAELLENEELVGVVQGCVKCVGTGCMGANVKIGCILGLRVSPKHRRLGIGLKLVKSIEEWARTNGAEYTLVATEENNIASKNLFALKCNYNKFSSLVIFTEPTIRHSPTNKGQDVKCKGIKIEKLRIDQAISFYKNRIIGRKEMHPIDIDTILKEKPSLGTWISCSEDEDWIGLHNNGEKTPSSWAVFSIWNACEDEVRIKRRPPLCKCFQAPLTCAREKKPFGFLFLYGILGEGERLQELVGSVWNFASRVAENVKDCKAMMTELGVSDPLAAHVPRGPSTCCIHDLWYLKRVCGPIHNENELVGMGQVGDVFVDPRDF